MSDKYHCNRCIGTSFSTVQGLDNHLKRHDLFGGIPLTNKNIDSITSMLTTAPSPQVMNAAFINLDTEIHKSKRQKVINIDDSDTCTSIVRPSISNHTLPNLMPRANQIQVKIQHEDMNFISPIDILYALYIQSAHTQITERQAILMMSALVENANFKYKETVWQCTLSKHDLIVTDAWKAINISFLNQATQRNIINAVEVYRTEHAKK